MNVRSLLWLPFALAAVGCIGTRPEQARYDELRRLGADDDGDEEHNPGYPCVDCHGRDYAPGDDVFALAGTVYLRASDPYERGLAGAVVHVRDAEGRELEVVSNEVGNFMVSVEGGEEDEGEGSEEGEIEIGWWPTYPLEVWVTQGELEQRMETLIEREESCAHCHWRDPSATSVGRIYLMEDGT
ncbi:MAG TPA: hypothetical protein RMH99_18750 [Sandaracinaceae bacterium LLY-WYZ-13_1]|nr:hypothetical protein [Sandaracinaceae bacterium LLY-WYZ-13_1]